MADEDVPVLRRSLRDFLTLELDEAALDRLSWRDFGNGLSMSRLAREGRRELVLYRIAADAADPFVKHEHLADEQDLVAHRLEDLLMLFEDRLRARKPQRERSRGSSLLNASGGSVENRPALFSPARR